MNTQSKINKDELLRVRVDTITLNKLDIIVSDLREKDNPKMNRSKFIRSLIDKYYYNIFECNE